MQLAKSDPPLLRRIIAFPDDGDVIFAFGQMAINAVGRDVQRAILKPFDAEISFVKTGILHFGKWCHPVEALGLLSPEAIRITDRLGISSVVTVRRDKRLFLPIIRNRIDFRHFAFSLKLPCLRQNNAASIHLHPRIKAKV